MEEINVIFDPEIFALQKFGGISRYFTEIFKEFNKHPKVKWILKGLVSRNMHLRTEIPKSQINYLNVQNHIIWSIILSAFNKIFTTYPEKKTSSYHNTLYHATYYNLHYLKKYEQSFRTVVTIYDLIDEFFDRDKKLVKNKKYFIENADMIHTISQSTADDIIKTYKVPADKITIIHLASSLRPISEINSNQSELPEKYILFVGNRDGYKNFYQFITAINPLLNRDKNLFLVCAGGTEFNEQEIQVLNQLNIKEQVYWKSVKNDSQLAWHYQHALFFVFPSKYEGFGIPILEAMNCNCPVVLSNTSSLKEIAANAGHYFDPNSTESIYNACLEVLESKELREKLISEGAKRRGDFSWEITAKKTVMAYEKLLASNDCKTKSR